ncbi:hypothetical protein [Streptomyces sp. NPDC050504]|uniref:hypothetical protein n=1 Tax=Streptomyces sp. NPDC050504 TaxID=3365618 RepID=UPI00379ACDDE
MSFGQGGPSWGPGGQEPQQNPYQSATPDWSAMADASAARVRRKRWLLIGGGALATAAVAAAVAAAVISTNGDDSTSNKSASELPTPTDLPSDTKRPEPSFSAVAPPPPPSPKEFISSSKKDKAPLSVDTLFPYKKLTFNKNPYLKAGTHRVTDCAAVAQGGLGGILTGNGCTQVMRVTYTRGPVAVTVGVAVFDTEAQATKAKEQRRNGDNIAPLYGAGAGTFCKGGPVCRFTTNAHGRYAYFTATGYTNGTSVTKGDKAAFAAGDDLAEFTFRQIVRRGELQASAAATAPADGQ